MPLVNAGAASSLACSTRTLVELSWEGQSFLSCLCLLLMLGITDDSTQISMQIFADACQCVNCQPAELISTLLIRSKAVASAAAGAATSAAGAAAGKAAGAASAAAGAAVGAASVVSSAAGVAATAALSAKVPRL